MPLRGFRACPGRPGGLTALEQRTDALLDRVGLLALGLYLQVLVPVLDRLRLVARPFVGCSRVEVRLGIPPLVLLGLRRSDVGVPGLDVSGLALLLVGERLGLLIVGLGEHERYGWVVRGNLSSLFKNFDGLSRLAVLKIETGQTPYAPWVLGVLFELGPGAFDLLLRADRGLSLLTLGVAAEQI